MYTFICVDGLGGLPTLTFASLKKALEQDKHEVILVNIDGIQTHEDRVQRTLTAFYTAKVAAANSWMLDRKIFLVGQSAGGAAVREAAHILRDDIALTGIIPMSQAMPRGIWYMTKQLWGGMSGRTMDLILGRDIHTTEAEYTPLIEPMAANLKALVVAGRQTIPGREARKLAFFPDRLKKFTCPALVIYGDKDQWIRPAAHRTLCKRMKKMGCHVTRHEIDGAGHLTLASDRSNEVIEHIKTWIELIKLN